MSAAHMKGSCQVGIYLYKAHKRVELLAILKGYGFVIAGFRQLSRKQLQAVVYKHIGRHYPHLKDKIVG